MKVLALTAFFGAAVAFGQSNDCNTLDKCQEALKTNRQSSLIHFRIGEIYFQQRNYVNAYNAFRASLAGDVQPRWTEVWGHINLGKIFGIYLQFEHPAGWCRKG
jgi:tetratricopeptide (TPR) repeat protein